MEQQRILGQPIAERIMKLTLIICTYMRAKPLLTLLESVKRQAVYPDEILIIDGSTNMQTKEMLAENPFSNLQYFLVSDKDRGLTRQRNFGISRCATDTDIICFLDDDTVLERNYFAEILRTYTIFPEALGVGGYINNEDKWGIVGPDYKPKTDEFFFDGWKKKDGSRFILRKKLGLDSNTNPGFLPEFSHGRSISFLPPSGKIYEVEQLMGGVSSFRKSVFRDFQFSTYFEGYGLYEDADFTLRLSKTGKLYINTNAQLGHYHDDAGRPNKIKYGKMVVRNGWYVWRVKHPNPCAKAVLKWHAITLLLAFIRFSNTFTTRKRKESFTEFSGRMLGWFSLIGNKPKIQS
jgi:GT2 family glycosyltransferase